MKSWRQSYTEYKTGYLRYLKKLGYGNHYGSFDFPFIYRAFIRCWAAPGFHYFWRYWNPGIGYLTYKLYRRLGGNRKRNMALIVTFFTSGLLHHVIVYPFLGWSFTLIIAFLSFAIFSLLSQFLEKTLKQKKWHWIVNSTINILLVILSFRIGFAGNQYIYYHFIQ